MRNLLSYAIILTILSVSLINANDIKRGAWIRGIPVQYATLYYPDEGTENWTCLDGSKTILFIQVNDDYCDCNDGSDEPGTSACPMTTFFCDNHGYRPMKLLSSRVNDGICDCCDGSDEYVNEICSNTCEKLGLAEKEEQKSREELHRLGSAKRDEMISKGKQLRKEREGRRLELEQRRSEQQSIKEEKENLQRIAEAAESEALETYRALQDERDAEAAKAMRENEPQSQRLEAETHFLFYDTNKDGILEIAELQVDMNLDRDRNGIVTIEEAKYFLEDRDRIDLDTFIAIAWPRIKPLKMLAEGIFKPPNAGQEEHDDGQAGFVEGSENIKLVEDVPEESESEDEHDDEEHEDDNEDENEHEDFEDDVDAGVGNVTPEEKPKIEYDPETQRFVDLANEARRATSDIENEIRETENEIKEIDDINKKDYGPNEEFAIMEGECFTFEDREYVYTLCPFDRASQRQKSGGSETTLGRWDQWVAEGENKYAMQKYAHGSSCWNGPQRSALVSLNCGLENKIISVSEPNRCEYFYEFETPSACDQINLNKNYDIFGDDIHDEL